MERKASAEKAVREIRRKTRRPSSVEEKIRIGIEGLRACAKSVSAPVLVLERDLYLGSIQPYDAVFDLHVKLRDFGDSQVL